MDESRVKAKMGKTEWVEMRTMSKDNCCQAYSKNGAYPGRETPPPLHNGTGHTGHTGHKDILTVVLAGSRMAQKLHWQCRKFMRRRLFWASAEPRKRDSVRARCACLPGSEALVRHAGEASSSLRTMRLGLVNALPRLKVESLVLHWAAVEDRAGMESVVD